MNWDKIIVVAEAALERERATLSPEIERIHSPTGKNETGIGSILLEIIAVSKNRDEVKLDSVLRSLTEEMPDLEREIRRAGNTCPKSPDGIHALPFPIPPDPRWLPLSDADKEKSQFCKYCGAGIW